MRTSERQQQWCQAGAGSAGQCGGGRWDQTPAAISSPGSVLQSQHCTGIITTTQRTAPASNTALISSNLQQFSRADVVQISVTPVSCDSDTTLLSIMALGHHDDEMWSKFDLFSDQKCVKPQFDAGDLFQDLEDSFLDPVEKSTVPDVSDHLLNIDFNDTFDSSCDELLLGVLDVDLQDSSSNDPLRHDCMWSGHSGASPDNDEKVRNSDQKKQSSYSPVPMLGVNSVFDTPLQSDFDTSDVEDDSINHHTDDSNNNHDEADDKEKMLSLDDPMYSDHCYISCIRPGTIAPPPAGMRDKNQEKHVTASISSDTRASLTIKTRPPADSRPSAKFKFQMKLSSSSSSSRCGDAKMRRLCGASTTRIHKNNYHKRQAALNNSFCQSPVKVEQVKRVQQICVKLKLILRLVWSVWDLLKFVCNFSHLPRLVKD